MMETKFEGKEEKYKITVVAILLTSACFSTYYFHRVLGIGAFFTHFFYIPIILSSLWWKRKGLIVAMFLAGFLIFSHILFRTDAMTLNDYARAFMFIVIALVIAILSEQIVKVEKKTKLAYAELNQIFHTAVDGMRVIDKHFNMVRVNQAFSTLSGISEGEAVGEKCYDLFHGPLCHTPSCLLTRILGGEERVECEVEKERTDGIRIPCILAATPFRGPGGELIGIVENLKDISERKKADETLIQSEKLRALGEMAAGVAHDFNNLLAIILGNAQLLERGIEKYKVEEIKHRLKIIARTASEGGEIVRRLQHFTGKKVSTEDFTRIDLNEIVREAIASTSPRWKDEAEAKGTTIKIKEKLGKLSSILGSRSGLMEVLTNLIFNALESMSEGGEITIRTEAKENEVYLYFTDTGQGIPDRIKEKIFDPFFTTKGPKASGLGLSISYGIIKHHRGKIEVESTEGEGTTFTISIACSPRS
jgi:PAS domain S-box-containing protein